MQSQLIDDVTDPYFPACGVVTGDADKTPRRRRGKKNKNDGGGGKQQSAEDEKDKSTHQPVKQAEKGTREQRTYSFTFYTLSTGMHCVVPNLSLILEMMRKGR